MKLETYKTFLDIASQGADLSDLIEARVLIPEAGWIQGGVSLSPAEILAIQVAASTDLDDGGLVLVELGEVIAIQAI